MSDKNELSIRRIKAAKKAAKTRKANRAAREFYEKFTVPANKNIDHLLHLLITSRNGIKVYWIGDGCLKNGAREGTLVKTFFGGKTWRVLIDGYKQPQDFAAHAWRVPQ